MEQYLIGLDGGQTSTKCVLTTLDGRILAQGSGGGLIHLAAAGGRERFVASLRAAIQNAWQAAGQAPQPLAAIGLGLTGVEAASAEAEIVRELLPAIAEARYADIQNDGIAAQVGAHLGGLGVIVISGTGSITIGRDAQERWGRVGGWGWLLGDEGSALAIGRDGLRAAFNAADGVQPETLLQPLMMAHFGTTTIFDVKRLVYLPSFGAAGFAALAPVVSQAAKEGDATAQQIIAQAGRDLAQAVWALQQKLAFPTSMPVAPIGGAFEHIGGLRTGFSQALTDRCPHALVVDPQLPPLLGAVLMAVRSCGGDVAGVATRLQEQWPMA